MRPILENSLDHCHLNDTLQCDAPTAEFIAKWIFEKVKGELEGLVAVTVQETRTGSVTYREPWRIKKGRIEGEREKGMVGVEKLVKDKRRSGNEITACVENGYRR